MRKFNDFKGVFLRLLLLVVSLFVLLIIIDPSATSNTIGVVVGGGIFGLIIWTPIRFIYGSDKFPNIRSFILNVAGIFALIYLLYKIAHVHY